MPPVPADGVFRRQAIWFSLVALGYFLALDLGFRFPDTGKAIAAIWPASGLGLAALLLSPRRRWPSILPILFVVGSCANLLSGRPFSASLGFMTANVLESFLCAWLISHFCGEVVRFSRVKEVVALLASAGLVNACTALLGGGTASLTTGASFWSCWLTWWVSNGLGIVVITPLLVVWLDFADWLPGLRWSRSAEAGAFLLVWVAAGWLTFHAPATSNHLAVQPYMLAGFLVWPALRMGQLGVTLALVVLSAIAITSPAASTAPLLLGASGPMERLLGIQLYIGFGAVCGLLIAASISETQSAERSSREEKSRLQALADNLPNGMVYQLVRERDGSSRFLYVSAGVERLNGCSAQEVLSDPAALYSMVVEEDRMALAAAEEAAAKDLRVHNVELRLRRRDGETRWMHLCSTPRQLPDGRVLWDGIQMDITERIQAGEEHTRIEEQLRQAQKMESIGLLAGGVAHDFNNLLTIINGYGDLVLADMPEGNLNRRRIEQIRKAGDRAAELTQQLLAFSRKQIIQPKPLNLNAIVSDVEKMFRRLVPENIEVVTRLDPSLGVVMADAGQTEQVLMNLAVNARDAMPGGGTLSIETSNFELGDQHVAEHPELLPGLYVLLEVTDTGIGMDESVREHIFEPFFTTKPRGAGTGLGLSTVYGIIRQNGGWVWVSSAPGKGTSFKIYLPRIDQQAQREESSAFAGDSHRGTETVMVVEDQPEVRALIKAVLETYGYVVLEAGEGNEALSLQQGHPGAIDLLLTDVVMPGMTVKDLTERFQARRPATKVLFMSGYTEDMIVHHGVLKPGVAFIPKPVTPQALVTKVRETLDHPVRPSTL